MLFFGVIGLYFPVRHFNSTDFDDPQTVFSNPHVLSGLSWASARWAFASQTLGIWQPLTMLSFLLDVRIFGPSAGEMHLHNLVLHALSSVGWYVLFRGMTGQRSASFFIAALFAFHPAHVESVAWITERKDVLSMLMLVISLIAYWRYAVSSSLYPYLCSLVFLALALMSKPMMVSQPILLLLLDVWPLGRTKWWRSLRHGSPTQLISIRRLIVEKIPFVILAMLACVVVLSTQSAEGAASDLTRITIGDRLSNSATGYMRYLGTAFWPCNLSVYYPYQFNIPAAAVLSSVALMLLITVAMFRLGRKRPYLSVGWIWFVLTLLPVIGIVQVGGQAMADRYTYLPFVGLAIMVVWPMAHRAAKSRFAGGVATFIGCGVLIACGVQTRMYLSCWSDTVRLFTQAAKVNGAPNWMIEYNLAEGYRLADQPAEAVAHYLAALRLNPNHFGSNLNLANLELAHNPPGEALPYYQKAVEVRPESGIAHYDYGLCLQALHKDADAAREFKKADQLGH